MIAKITTGSRPGDIGAYLHGPGKANEHEWADVSGRVHAGGQVIGGNLPAYGQTDPAGWAAMMRQAIENRPEAKKPVWQASLRNTEQDRTLSDAEWADAGQSFAEQMGFEDHPWVMVRHGHDHVHLVVSRVDFEGELWSRSHDWRKAQRATSALEDAYGLEKAPRQRTQAKQPAGQVYAGQRAKAANIEADRENLRQTAAIQQAAFPTGPQPGRPRAAPAAAQVRPQYSRGQRQGLGKELGR